MSPAWRGSPTQCGHERTRPTPQSWSTTSAMRACVRTRQRAQRVAVQVDQRRIVVHEAVAKLRQLIVRIQCFRI